jgi:adenylate kinase
MLNIILFGPPGAGKGTQSGKLIEKYKLTHLSTGDVFRYNIKNETALGVLAKGFIDKGALVPDEVTNNMVKDFVKRNLNEYGFIFDGYPRTIAQGEELAKILEETNTEVSMMLALEVDEDELVKRLLERGKTSGRVDDQNEDTIRTRFKVYKEETSPLATFYSAKYK